MACRPDDQYVLFDGFPLGVPAAPTRTTARSRWNIGARRSNKKMGPLDCGPSVLVRGKISAHPRNVHFENAFNRLDKVAVAFDA
jgi:hypothetical protein